MKKVKLPSGSVLEIADDITLIDAMVDVCVQLDVIKSYLKKYNISEEELVDLIYKTMSQEDKKEDLSKFEDIKIN